MNNLIAFIKKEMLEQTRSKRLMIVGLLFIFFGVMNPLTAKITPMILEMLSESMENSGIIITDVEVTALDSWMQYFKNLPTVLIAFILIESSIFAKDYQKGTLILVLSKGFKRYKIVISKLLVMIGIWTVGYLLYFIVTYAYTIYYWDNSIVSNLGFSVLIWWIFGILIISIFMLFAVKFENNGTTLALTAAVILPIYIISLLPKMVKYLPINLTNGTSLVYGLEEVSYYIPSLIISLCLIVICIVFSIITFNKKKL